MEKTLTPIKNSLRFVHNFVTSKVCTHMVTGLHMLNLICVVNERTSFKLD